MTNLYTMVLDDGISGLDCYTCENVFFPVLFHGFTSVKILVTLASYAKGCSVAEFYAWRCQALTL
jgi:hypothetical protein